MSEQSQGNEALQKAGSQGVGVSACGTHPSLLIGPHHRLLSSCRDRETGALPFGLGRKKQTVSSFGSLEFLGGDFKGARVTPGICLRAVRNYISVKTC